jgi:hypothetical protein
MATAEEARLNWERKKIVLQCIIGIGRVSRLAKYGILLRIGF